MSLFLLLSFGLLLHDRTLTDIRARLTEETGCVKTNKKIIIKGLPDEDRTFTCAVSFNIAAKLLAARC